MKGDQLGLLLWKNYIVRKRGPGILCLVFFWPIIVFMIIYAVRDNIDPEYYPTCHFPARLMPYDGLLPFVQSFICSLDNSCEPLSEYELVPSYKNASLGPLILSLQPMLGNDTIIAAVKTFPKSIRLLKSMAEILTKPEIKQLFGLSQRRFGFIQLTRLMRAKCFADKGIRLGDLFNNHEVIKKSLMEQLPTVEEDFIDGLFNASIKLLYLIETFGSSNIGGIICSPESLKKYLVMEREEDLLKVSKILCEIDSAKIPDILEQMTAHLDFGELLEMVSRVMAKFRDYDLFRDIRQTLQHILKLSMVEKYVPRYLKIREWLPQTISLFKNVTFKEIDLTFINKMVNVLDPVFAKENEWKVAKRGLLNINSLLEIIKGIFQYENTTESSLAQRRKRHPQDVFYLDATSYENITNAIDISFQILQDGIRLTNSLLERHKEEIQIAREVFLDLKTVFATKVVNVISYMLSMTRTVVRASHHIAILHEEFLHKMYLVALKHNNLVQQILMEIDSSAYRTAIRTFSHQDVLERLIEKFKGQRIGSVICQEEILNEIFDEFKEMKSQSEKINNLLCSDEGKNYISDVYDEFELEDFGKIVNEMLSTFLMMAVQQPATMNSNFTSVTKSVNHFITYLNSPKTNHTVWSNFSVPTSWKNAFMDTTAQGRLVMLGMHLSIAKIVGMKSLSYVIVKPKLTVMDMLADVILQDLQEKPTQWIGEARKHEFQLIESFYLTVTDREKVLDILGYYNFSRTYCIDSNPPQLVNYPIGSNETLLKSIVCRLSSTVQSDLELNVRQIQYEKDLLKRKQNSFDWTLFNQKIIKIYSYIDSLVHQRDQDYDYKKLETLIHDFSVSWSVDITVRDAWEFGVGFLCKLFDVVESPLFNVQASRSWSNLYAVTWASSLLFDGLENIVDQIQRNNYTVKLGEILTDMPQTEILMSAILRNIASVTLDVVDMITMKAPIHFISAISNYISREPDWPCLRNESLGAALELRNGSREVIREIERISCNPGLFIKEWKEQPILSRARKIFQEDDNAQIPAFNWTLGYNKFRRLVEKFDNLLNSFEKIVLADNPTLSNYRRTFFPEVQKVIEDRLSDVNQHASNLLYYVDLELDKSINNFLETNSSASEVWTSAKRDASYFLILGKFVIYVFDEAMQLVLTILEKDAEHMDMLSLLGFENKSVISLVYQRLPYILATLINALTDPDVDNRIVSSLEKEEIVPCPVLFSWFYDYRIGLNADEYMIIKNFTCDGDSENFNSYLDLIMQATVTWRRPISKYRLRLAVMINDLYKIGLLIDKMMKSQVEITLPFSGNYFHDLLFALKKSLSVIEASGIVKENLQTRTYRLIMEGISEALMNIAHALKNAQIKDNQLHTWDLFESGDVKKILRLLESHSVKTITLFASTSWISTNANQGLQIKDLRRSICDLHLKSEFWARHDFKHFLYEICSFDPYELLKGITSPEYHEMIVNSKDRLQVVTPLAKSVSMLVDETINVMTTNPNIVFRSNLLNFTTWKTLPNETLKMLDKVEESWIHEFVVKLKASNGSWSYGEWQKETNLTGSHELPFIQIGRLMQLLTSILDLLSGGDAWQKIRFMYDTSKIKSLLNVIEDLPNLTITVIDTFINSERLIDFFDRFFMGQVNFCDIDKYLIPPSFMRKKGLLSSVASLCQKLINGNDSITIKDLLPFESKAEDNYTYDVIDSVNSSKTVKELNETFLIERIRRLRLLIFRIGSEGFKEFKVPKWWTSFEEGTFKDFLTQYRNKDLRTVAHSVTKKLMIILNSSINKYVSDRTSDVYETFILEIINSQLSRHSMYSDFLCKMHRLKMAEIENIMLRDFYWNKTINMITGYKYLSKKKSLPELMIHLENTFHYVTDILVDFENVTYREQVEECFYKVIGKPSFSRPGLYITMLVGILDVIGKNIHILDTKEYHEKLLNLTIIMKNHVEIWKSLQEVTQKSYSSSINNFLPNAMINVNLVASRTSLNATFFYDILNSKQSKKLLKYDPKVAKYPTILEISEKLNKSLDFVLINRNIMRWRRQAATDLSWVKKMLRNFAFVLEESGSLLDIASKIDFDDVSNVLGVPDLADGLVNLLQDKTVDKLFDGLREIVEDAEPLIEDREVVKDLHSMVEIMESMEIFKNLGLLNMKYMVKDLFTNWDDLRRYLTKEVNFSNDIVQILSEAKVDMLSVFMKERNAISLKDTICSPEKLDAMLNFDQSEISGDHVSTVLCQLDGEQTQSMVVVLIKNLNFEYIFKNLMSANVKNILTNANLTETDVKDVIQYFGVASELVPMFKDKLSLPSSTNNTTDENTTQMSSMQFLSESSEMLCGKQLISNNGELYKVLSSIEDSKKNYDVEELNALPTEFCRDTYKGILAMNGGKIIWSYVKPLLRGHILYSPNTTVMQEVMQVANRSFNEMEWFTDLMKGFESTLVSLASLSEMSGTLKDLKDIMSSDVMKVAIKSMSGGSFEGDLSNFDLSEVAWRLKRSPSLINMINMLNNLMDCVLVNRVEGFSTEEELERTARDLMETNDLLAAVVFFEESSGRSKRSLNRTLPDNVGYKIRMDIDYVPSTKRLKKQFWIPGPESDFIEDLRYLRGFVQLQDSIDRAIIEVKAPKGRRWKTLTQQMPYPCWKRAPFQSTLYESQGIQVSFFFALMMCVGAAVRHIVWERESQNAMVMSVMGLKPWRNTLAWFITSFVELTIVMLTIFIILTIGDILPKSDATLLLLLLLDYVFSTVTFCYMISTMFSSASLAAVTTVVLFLLTYMPYIIVIAMEASMGLIYKILICLSMSTSFCYGCLYAARKEVQGTGLQWSTIWEEQSPGDAMSLGLVLCMIFIDGCIYALIGYSVARYTNSDATTDSTSLTRSEKHVGVTFDGVRKVYHTNRGECVAVDDFTLKLCENEVTSLLGRNGAGKTTIIKMLTGMICPTSGEICLNGEENEKLDIGVCPQENVLISTLTPREHMIFYAKLKKPTDHEKIIQYVNEMMASLELGRQENEPVSRLSGGTRRRLCVALAFLGYPKLVILDEPGAGVDPAARRRIWRLIDQYRKGRTVLLSTHHLDEADMLSDTVVIMHKGKILCTGSPLSLKTTYGRGYRMHISFPQGNPETSAHRKILKTVQTLIKSVVPNAQLQTISDSEIFIHLPFLKKPGVQNDIAEAAKILEDNKKLLAFSHLSLECDTLERVFLDLCTKEDVGSIMSSSRESITTTVSNGTFLSTDDIDLIGSEPMPKPSPLRQVKALLTKKLWHFARDWRAPLAALFLPTMFVTVAMGFSLIRPPSEDEPPLILSPKLYDTHQTYFYSIDNGDDPFLQHVSLQLHDRFGDDYAGAWQIQPNDTGTCECLDGQQVCHGVSQAVEGLFQTLPGRPTLDWIVSTQQEYIEKRYGGWSLSHSGDDPLFVVWYNNKGHHALPAYLNSLNEAILRSSGVPGRLTAINHPLKLSTDQLSRTTLLQHVADVGVALVLLVAFNLVGAQGARELVRERLSEEKRILYLAGMHPVTYWTTAFLWDFFVFGCSICLAVVVFEIFGLPAYVARDNLPGVCLLLALFAWAIIPLIHLSEKCFDDASLSNMVLFCVNTFIGVVSLATILVIDILGKTKTAEDVRNILHHVLLLFPQYALGDGLVQMTKNDIAAELLNRFDMDVYKSPLGWELLGLHFVILFVIGAVLFLANLLIECRAIPNIFKRRPVYEPMNEDEDVARERIRVESRSGHDVLRTVKLRKEYRSVYGTNVAVQNLSLGVQAGSCFGLLGVNGAGKSTTFKMLTTETRPTGGKIFLRETDIGSGPLCNGEVGYCPQWDALDGFLSPHQTLTLHGQVCGLVDVPRAVERMLKRFDLIKYAHRRIDRLSGGNKRKLCAAISVMAPVSVVLMDEPTSGMDPASKELVSKAIRHVTRNQGCVILTSHSVADCEKICTRVGILAKAGLRCIGTPTHLKHRFSEGYVVQLRFSQAVSLSDLKRAICKHLPSAVVSSRQAAVTRLLLPRGQDISLSDTFVKVRELAEELKATDYTLTQSSLDQVLVNFSEELEDDSTDTARYASENLTSVYSSRDTIHMETF